MPWPYIIMEWQHTSVVSFYRLQLLYFKYSFADTALAQTYRVTVT